MIEKRTYRTATSGKCVSEFKLELVDSRVAMMVVVVGVVV